MTQQEPRDRASGLLGVVLKGVEQKEVVEDGSISAEHIERSIT
jgi:hypothetical protein